VTLALAAAVTGLLALGTAVAWRAGGPAERPLDPLTPVRVLVLGYLVLYGTGSVVLAATDEGTGGPLLVGAAMVAIGAGTWIARRLLGTPAVPVTPPVVGPVRGWAVVALAATGLLMYLALAVEHGVPLLSGDAQAARAGFAGIRWDLFRWLVPPAALLALAVALTTRRREARAVAAVAVGAVLGLEVLAASRALPFELGLAAILLAAWAGHRFRWRAWLLIGAVAAVVFLGVLFARVAPEGSFSGPLDALTFAWNRTVGRVVMIQARTIDLIVEAFPGQEPYLLGSSYLRWLDRVQGEDPEPALGSWLFEQLFPDEPPGGFAAPGILGEGYANFGPVWALALMVALGAATGALGTALGRASPGSALRVLFALLTVVALRTYAASLNGTVLTAAAAVAWYVAAGARVPGRLRPGSGRRRDPEATGELRR
jgi:hypothetical protein